MFFFYFQVVHNGVSRDEKLGGRKVMSLISSLSCPPFFLCDVLTALGNLLKLHSYLWVLAIFNKIKLLRSSTKHPLFFFFPFVLPFTVYTLAGQEYYK